MTVPVTRDRPRDALAASVLGLLAEQVEELAAVDAGREPGDVLEVGVPPDDRLARIDHQRVQPVAGGEYAGREPGHAAADDHDLRWGSAAHGQMSPLIASATRCRSNSCPSSGIAGYGSPST